MEIKHLLWKSRIIASRGRAQRRNNGIALSGKRVRPAHSPNEIGQDQNREDDQGMKQVGRNPVGGMPKGEFHAYMRTPSGDSPARLDLGQSARQ